MGVTRKVLSNGNGKDYPEKGDVVTIEYTGNLYDAKAEPHHQGQKSVSIVASYLCSVKPDHRI